MMLSALGLVLALLLAHDSQGTAPHIVLIVADDYGWNDVGYHQNQPSSANPKGDPTTNAVIRTPNLDSLASQGVKLENYYVQPLCSPTRGTIMTGRYPSHTGIGPSVIRPVVPYAMPKDEVFMPQLLKERGYATHAVGKWHLGYCDERYSPTFRGFDSFLGYLNGAEDYWTHERSDSGFSGLDLRNGTTANQLPAALKTMNGKYSTHVFTAEAVRLIESHDKTTPFFLYLPYQAVHEPEEAPQSYIDPYVNIINASVPHGKSRLIDAGMVSAMDEGVGNVTKALKAAGMWEDTVIIFTTDNGGPLYACNNFPLRGHKSTNWEGGVRGVAFVKGTESSLAPIPAGTRSMELMHSTDWLPTVVEGLAKGDTGKCRPLDGFNQWGVLSGAQPHTKREFVIHNVPAAGSGLAGGAVRKGQYKLLVSGMQTEGGAAQTPPPGYNPGSLPPIPKPAQYNGTDVWLFDVISDPIESVNLAESHSAVLDDMVSFYLDYQKTAVADLALTHGELDPTSNPKLRSDGTWGPFPESAMCHYV
eukprot:Sspe_Gene.115545::Locus_103128_Transcript_1_1_Confidence_1.000_Length_1764::g.115545::m.115545/K01135/ARSB; arylsulfatase B